MSQYKPLTDELFLKGIEKEASSSTGDYGIDMGIQILVEQARRANRLAEAVAAWAGPLDTIPTDGEGPGTAAFVEKALAVYRGDAERHTLEGKLSECWTEVDRLTECLQAEVDQNDELRNIHKSDTETLLTLLRERDALKADLTESHGLGHANEDLFNRERDALKAEVQAGLTALHEMSLSEAALKAEKFRLLDEVHRLRGLLTDLKSTVSPLTHDTWVQQVSRAEKAEAEVKRLTRCLDLACKGPREVFP